MAAPLFPLTHALTPGGLDQSDQFNQPADMRFVITSMTAPLPAPLTGLVSPTQIGVAGHSDGAVTTLAFLNTCCSDTRVKAAVVLAETSSRIPAAPSPEREPGDSVRARHARHTVPLRPDGHLLQRDEGPKASSSLTGAGHADWFQPSAKWFGSVAATTSDFWRAHLEHETAAAQRLPHDAQPGVSMLYSAPAPGSSLTAPLLPRPKTDRRASVSPTRNLTSGERVTVRWKGYLRGGVVNVLECSSIREAGCDVGTGRLLIPDPEGRGEVTLRIVVGAVGNGTCDAAHPHCQVLVNDAALEAPATVNIPITIGSGPPH